MQLICLQWDSQDHGQRVNEQQEIIDTPRGTTQTVFQQGINLLHKPIAPLFHAALHLDLLSIKAFQLITLPPKGSMFFCLTPTESNVGG